MTSLPPRVVTQEIQIVDSQGSPRLLLSAKSGSPAIELLRADGTPIVVVTLDAGGHPSMRLDNPDAEGPTAVLEVDDKGAHVKFDRPGGGSSYLFLNNAGGSGVVLVDTTGARRLDAQVAPDGTAKIDRYGADGKLLP
jgi:hypothetical protein